MLVMIEPSAKNGLAVSESRGCGAKHHETTQPRAFATSIFCAALGAELRRAFRLVAASAARLLRRQRAAALLAELSALRLRAALRADRAGDLGDVARLRPVHLARLALHLLARGLGLRRGHLLVEIGRAVLAQPGLLVPADGLADPVAAAR